MSCCTVADVVWCVELLRSGLLSNSGAGKTFSRGPLGGKKFLNLKNGAFWCTLYFLSDGRAPKCCGVQGNLPPFHTLLTGLIKVYRFFTTQMLYNALSASVFIDVDTELQCLWLQL